jgi:hypothetical protein
MPQGVYPIKTTVIIDGKEYAPVENKMQLVMNQNDTFNNLLIAEVTSR